MTKVLKPAAARREIDRRLKQYARDAPNEVKRVMRKSAADIVSDMRHMADDDPILAASISYGENPPSGPSGMMKSSGTGKGFHICLWAGSKKAFWARWREHGTEPHSVAKGASRKRGKRQNKGPHHPGEHMKPYFWPIWRAHRKPVQKAMRKAYRTVGEEIFGK